MSRYKLDSSELLIPDTLAVQYIPVGNSKRMILTSHVLQQIAGLLPDNQEFDFESSPNAVIFHTIKVIKDSRTFLYRKGVVVVKDRDSAFEILSVFLYCGHYFALCNWLEMFGEKQRFLRYIVSTPEDEHVQLISNMSKPTVHYRCKTGLFYILNAKICV